MKRFILALALIAPIFSHAESNWDTARKKELGRYVETSAVTVSTSAATVLWTQTVRAVTTDIFNNSAYTLWIGTNAANLQSTGFPVISSKTYTVDGLFTGTVYGLADSAAGGSTNTRIIQYKMQAGD